MTAAPELKMVYLAMGPGYWAADIDVRFAVAHLLSMYTENSKPTTKIDLFHVSEDWEMDGFSVRAKKVKRLANLEIPQRLAAKVRTALSELEDAVDAFMIAQEKLEESVDGGDVTK